MDRDGLVRRLFPKGFGDRDRAIFEAGIALGSLYHQFSGVPIARDPGLLRLLERAICKSMALQPYRERIDVKILDSEVKGAKADEYDYELLKGRHMDVRVVVRYGSARVTARMRYEPKLEFTLMYVESIEGE